MQKKRKRKQKGKNEKQKFKKRQGLSADCFLSLNKIQVDPKTIEMSLRPMKPHVFQAKRNGLDSEIDLKYDLKLDEQIYYKCLQKQKSLDSRLSQLEQSLQEARAKVKYDESQRKEQQSLAEKEKAIESFEKDIKQYEQQREKQPVDLKKQLQDAERQAESAEKAFIMATKMLRYAEKRGYDLPGVKEDGKLKFRHTKKQFDDWKKRLRAIKQCINAGQQSKE